MKKSLSSFSSVRTFKDFYHIDKMLKLLALKFQFLESSEPHPSFFKNIAKKTKDLSSCLTLNFNV